MLKNISILDTSICTRNLGDLIIMDSVHREIENFFPKCRVFSVPTHEKIGRASYSILRKSNIAIAGGTNLLSPKINKETQWNITILDSLFVNNVVLLGVGWLKYEMKSNIYSKFILRRMLDKRFLHSVRDFYTKQNLENMGISNVINTGCPTLWQLDENHCKSIPKTKSLDVVFTLTDYHRHPENDLALIKILEDNYETVYFWPQGARDMEYLTQLLPYENKIHVLEPSLRAYDLLLDKSNGVDYIGTRLHAGIRAMQKRRRSIILSIDNRAIEMGKDFGLPVIHRDSIVANLHEMINSNFSTQVILPVDNIERWRNQFVDFSK